MNYLKYIKEKTGNSTDYIYKSLKINRCTVNLIFNEVLTDTEVIDDFILRKLFKLRKHQLKKLDNYLPDTNIKMINVDDIFNYLNKGFVLVIYKDYLYVIEARQKLDRGINEVSNELSIKGPKDSFSENFNTNVGLIRRRIKDENLWIKELTIGRRTKTKSGVFYINNIANVNTVKKVTSLLESIDVDGIIDSTYLLRKLESRDKTVFPTIISTERPDKVCMALLDGKIAILIDMSPYVLILPNFFIDYFHNPDDYYQKNINITFIRVLRLISFFFAIIIPGYYIALTTHNQELLPLNILLSLKMQRSLVPFSSVTEAIFMSICFEILRESDIRMASTTGSAISILGGLILGDAAVNAGIISPIMIIVIAISSISGLVFSSIELVSAVRWWRFIFIFMGALLGINGIVISSLILFLRLVTIKTFNLPYLYPFFPFNKKEQKDAIVKANINTRNSLLTFNKYRGE